MNKVILIGNLGADPEIKTSAGGVAWGNLRIATSDRKKDRDGNWNEATEWHRVKVFGKTAENCQRFLRKGSKVGVEGSIETEKWTNKEGVDQYSTNIIARNVEFLSPKGEGGGQRGGGGHGPSSRDTGRDTRRQGPTDDDIPFLDSSLSSDPMSALRLLLED